MFRLLVITGLLPLRFLFFLYVFMRRFHRGLILNLAIKGDFTEAPLSHGIWTLIKPAKDRFYLFILELASALKAVERKKIKLKKIRITLESHNLGWAQAWEVRSILIDFRQQQVYTEVYLLSDDRISLFIASAADFIYSPAGSTFDFSPFTHEAIFLQSLFAKLGVKPQFISVGTYKSAAEIFTKTKMSPAARKQSEELLSDIENTFFCAIEEKTKVQISGKARKILDTTKAQALGFVDAICSYSEFNKRDEDENLSSIDNFTLNKLVQRFYFRLLNFKKKKRVALIMAQGNIIESSQPRPGTINWPSYQEVADALREDGFAGALVRVDSPGGSALVSQLLWKEWMLATGKILPTKLNSEKDKINPDKEDEKREEKKIPIFVSQGNVAASGGYYLSATGDKIFSTPVSITGSIGVVGGKFNIAPFLKKLGVTVDRAPLKNPSPLLSPFTDFSKDDQRALSENMHSIYEQFLRDVALGRGCGQEEIRAHASGRVYSGERAQKISLVDSSGGISHALYALRNTLGVKQSESIELVVLPTIKESLFNRSSLPLGIQALASLSDFSKYAVYAADLRFLLF